MVKSIQSFLIGVLAGLGGGTGVIIIILRYFADSIVFKVQKNYETKLLKETHVFETKHSSLQNISCAFLSLFDVIIKCTEDYESGSNGIPKEDKCLEVKDLIGEAKTTIYKAMPIFEDDFMKSLEETLGHMNDQYKSLCCGDNDSVPYTVTVIKDYQKDFMDNISKLQKSIYNDLNISTRRK
jgi:hypothetical protein